MDDSPKTIVVAGFDWADLAQTDPEKMREKLDRDGLLEGEHNIVLLHWAPSTYTKQLDERITLVRVRARFHHLRPLYDLLAHWVFSRALREAGVRPDVLVAYDSAMLCALRSVRAQLGGILALFLTNVPSTLLRTRRGSLVRGWYQCFVDRLALPHLDRAYVISGATKGYLIERGVPEEKIEQFAPKTIPSDVDDRIAASRGSIRAQYMIPEGTRVLLTVGRLEHEKGIDRLLHVFAQIDNHDLTLIVAGDGVLRPALERLATELGIAHKVIFAGNVPHDDLWGYYADADVFVLLSRSEALGLVVWEAFAARVPVVVSYAEGLMESVGKDGDRGFVWEESMGPHAFRERIDRACTDGAAAKDMLDRAQQYVRTRTSDAGSLLSHLFR